MILNKIPSLDKEDENQISDDSVKKDIKDMHYAQLFYVVGHVALKSVIFVE